MYPVLFSIGPFHLFSLSVFLVVGWLVFSFLFWKLLRASGVDEDKIFDITFYATLVSFVASRLVFVVLNWQLFADTPLKIAALWVQPGLSLAGGLVGGVATVVIMSRSLKVRLGYVLDALAVSLPGAYILGFIGSFLDGSEVGKMTNVPWAVRYVGHVGRRFPVQLFEIVGIIIILIAIIVLQKKGAKRKWPYGLVGIWFFLLYSIFMFGIEFMKDTHVYLKSLSVNQWVAIAVFAEALGALYVRGGGRDALRPFYNSTIGRLVRLPKTLYAKFSK